MRRHTPFLTVMSAAIGLGLALLSAPVCAQVDDPVKRQKIEETVRIIKDVSREEASDDDSAIVIKPYFEFNKTVELAWIDYSFGGVAVDNLGLRPGDPYRLPYTMQIQVEALRRVFEGSAGLKPFWRPHLESAERLVRLTVEDIESTPNQRDLDSKLTQRSREFLKIREALNKSVREYATAEGLQVGNPNAGPKGNFGEPEPFSVKVKTEPSGGKVRVVTAFVWRMCVKRNCDQNQLVWRTLNVGGVEGLIGGYHYTVEWADGRDEGDMKIERDQEREFRPSRRN